MIHWKLLTLIQTIPWTTLRWTYIFLDISFSILVSFRVIEKSGLMFKFGTGLLKTVKFLPTLTEDVTSSFFVMADNKSKSITRFSALSLNLLLRVNMILFPYLRDSFWWNNKSRSLNFLLDKWLLFCFNFLLENDIAVLFLLTCVFPYNLNELLTKVLKCNHIYHLNSIKWPNYLVKNFIFCDSFA